jgi:hypothetical protein
MTESATRGCSKGVAEGIGVEVVNTPWRATLRDALMELIDPRGLR